MAPRLIHVIYFPWDEQHRLKADEEDFDHGPVEALRDYAPDFEVRLWTYSKAREFCRNEYPTIWATVEKCPHPTMMVDILRWVVVYHFGGIYWQVSTTPLVEMGAILPSPGKDVRLFTEFELRPEQCQAMAAEPIRQGEPEEPVRVMNQVFAAEPRAGFIRHVLDLVVERNRTLTPRNDYDILFIGANAALSTAYDRHGKRDPAVERMDRESSRRMIKWNYLGSWRTGVRKAPPDASASPGLPRGDRFPSWAALYYRIRRHVHEACLAQADAIQARTSYLPHVAALVEPLGIRTVYEVPSGAYVSGVDGVAYTGGDPCREVVKRNRRLASGQGVRFRHVHLLYSRLPQVDLFICPDYLERLSHAEGMRVLRRIVSARPRYLALTGCRLLRDNWDTALGDYRPVNPQPSPYGLGRPREMIELPGSPGRRPDRCLMVWEQGGRGD